MVSRKFSSPMVGGPELHRESISPKGVLKINLRVARSLRFLQGAGVSSVTSSAGHYLYPFPVPTGLKRYYGGGDLHFITCSCYHRIPWLNSARRRDLFFSILEQTRQRCRFVVFGYVVMPEHFHLLISEPQQGDPSKIDAIGNATI